MIGHDAFLPTDADCAALRRIAKDRKVPVHQRFHAEATRAVALSRQGKFFEASKADTQSLQLAELATPEHRAEKVMAFQKSGKTMDWMTIGEQMDEELRWARSNNIAGQLDGTFQAPEVEGATIGTTHDSHRTTVQLAWPVASSDPAEQAANLRAGRRALLDRRAACAECGAGGEALQRCGKCGLAYYCSRTCQRAGWAAHKPQCRPPGEHRLRDIVQLQGVQAAPELNGQLAMVASQDPDSAGCWLVGNCSWDTSKRVLSVPGDSLRPLLTH